MNPQQQQLNINLENTQGVKTEDGNVIFQQGYILRTVSKFVVGGDEDAVMPIPVFYDPSSNKILESTLPKELRKEYKDQTL